MRTAAITPSLSVCLIVLVVSPVGSVQIPIVGDSPNQSYAANVQERTSFPTMATTTATTTTTTITTPSYRTAYAFAREMYPKTEKGDIQYGTAGFRTKATKLGYVMYRMGLLAVLRARYKKAAIGVMITASHNPEPDNGVKLVDPHGEMLEQSWEKWATKFANVGDDQLEATIQEIIKEYSIEMTDRVHIFIGKDTRPSSPSLSENVRNGVLALSGKPIDYGIVTTPQLHYFVHCRNTKEQYGVATEEGYYKKLTTAFKKLRGDEFTRGNYTNRIYYDGANGVGAKKIKFFQERLGESLSIRMFNDAIIGTGKLNHLCGSDHVKSKQTFPEGLPRDPNVRCVSVDGDADRVVYYYLDDEDNFHLLDGDRIGSLIAAYLKDELVKSGVDLNMGLVQTAYANGASTEYIRNKLLIPVAFTQTGVKNLHHRALDYDIGVYFEANGHGTILFSDNAKTKLKQASADENLTDKERGAAARLLLLIDVVNETVGDAISDMLVVESVLHARGWGVREWEEMYGDLPNRLEKVTVQDRTLITTSGPECTVLTPAGLQDEINGLVGQYRRARAFVRASGTEDVIRVYAEAETATECDALARRVSQAVYDMAAGSGERPKDVETLQNGVGH